MTLRGGISLKEEEEGFYQLPRCSLWEYRCLLPAAVYPDNFPGLDTLGAYLSASDCFSVVLCNTDML